MEYGDILKTPVVVLSSGVFLKRGSSRQGPHGVWHQTFCLQPLLSFLVEGTMRARRQMTLIFGQRTGGRTPALSSKPSLLIHFSLLCLFLCFLRVAASEHEYLHWLHLRYWLLATLSVNHSVDWQSFKTSLASRLASLFGKEHMPFAKPSDAD